MTNTTTNTNKKTTGKIRRTVASMLAAVMVMTTAAAIGASAADTTNAVVNMNTNTAATVITADNFITKPEFKSFGSSFDFNSVAKDLAGVGAESAIKAVAGDGIAGALLSKGAEYILGMIFDSEAEPTISDVLNKLDELSDKIDGYHDEEMRQLKAINSNIDSKDFRMEADSIKDDYRAVIRKIQQYSDNITTPGEGVIDNTTYKAYKEILAQPTCNLSTLEKNFNIMVDYVKGNRSSSDHTSGYKLTSQYLMDKILANYKETQHDWAKSPDFLEYLETINREIELMESNVVLDYYTILAVNNMAYKVREYEVENGLYTVNDNEKAYSSYERFAYDLTESLKSIDGIYKETIDENNHNGDFMQGIAEIPDAIGGKKVKGFHTFSEAWAQTYKTGSKTYTLKLNGDIKADSKKGFNFDKLSQSTYQFHNKGGFHINEGRTVNIDLGGHTIDCSADSDIILFAIHKNTNLTVSNGTVSGAVNLFDTRDRNNVNLTLKNLTLKDSELEPINFECSSNANCSLTMDNCKVENCNHIYIYSSKAKITVKNTEFANNSSYYNGGVIKTNSEQYPLFENCTFRNNQSMSRSGAIDASTVECRNCTFDSNDAPGGGAITTIHAKLYNCTFTKNHASSYGGAVCVTGLSSTIEGCKFKGNMTGNSGGALYLSYCYSDKDMIVKNNTFTGNEAKNGAAIYISYLNNVTRDDIANKWGNTGSNNNAYHNYDTYWGIY